MQPKVYLETLILIIGIVFIYSMNFTTSSIESNLAFIAILAYGIQKTIPHINNIYNLTINFKSVKPTIISFLKILDSGNKGNRFEDNEVSGKINFENEIKLKNVYFKYDEKNKNILNGINITIKKGAKVAIKGKTGSGKTTLINIIAGLLDSTKGNLIVDDVPINKKNKKNGKKI